LNICCFPVTQITTKFRWDDNACGEFAEFNLGGEFFFTFWILLGGEGVVFSEGGDESPTFGGLGIIDNAEFEIMNIGIERKAVEEQLNCRRKGELSAER
jgi:hypothetical protein